MLTMILCLLILVLPSLLVILWRMWQDRRHRDEWDYALRSHQLDVAASSTDRKLRRLLKHADPQWLRAMGIEDTEPGDSHG